MKMWFAFACLFFGLGCFVTAFAIWYFHDRAKAKAIMQEAADALEEKVKG
jgi:Flp pilus assembly protein TadG